MARLKIDNCPVCSEIGVSYLQVEDRITSEEFNLSNCLSCSSFFLSDPPTPDTLSKYYSEEADNLYWEKPSGTFSFLLDFALGRDLNGLFKKLSNRDLVVELGAGTGQISRYIKSRGYFVHAVDMYEEALWQDSDIPYTSLDLNEGAVGSFLERVSPKAVVLRHTLEHVFNPQALIEEFFKSGVEYVLIVVPNAGSRFRKLFGRNWSYWDAPRHLTHFTTKSLNRLLSQARYSVIEEKVYGTDEVITSIHHMLLAGAHPKKDLANIFHPRGPLTALSAAAFFWANNNICMLAKKN